MPTRISGNALSWPTVLALRELDGSGNTTEIDARVIELSDFTEAQMAEMMPNGRSTKVNYYLAWARTNLKRISLVDNSSRAIWTLTARGLTVSEAECKRLLREFSRHQARRNRDAPVGEGPPMREPDSEDEPDTTEWRTVVLDRLKAMSPGAFERLAQRILREAGFRNVQVLGKSGDGGIDGVGTYRLSLVSFTVYFQCKRYQGSVSSGAVRDFRGAMAGRGEKGLLITTGVFTQAARDEATRDGAAPVELVSGESLCDLLKEYEIGIRITKREVEDIEVVPTAFDQFEN